MNEEYIKTWLISKFTEIERRILLVLDQLSDEQVNWIPNKTSNSISNLIIHIDGNISERISKGIHNKSFERNREAEFDDIFITKSELEHMVKSSFGELLETTKNISSETIAKTQLVRNRERSNVEILLQCATHFSEHMGQILYIAKMCLDDSYETTSIPRRA
jgi:uncharacterized damage-inducible protein DinB